jgi:F-type H+-transporting ATPase subunit epsilon
MALLHLHLLTPEKNFFDADVDEVIFSTAEGSLGIMAGHSPAFASVIEGVIQIMVDGAWRIAASSQGFARINYDIAEFYLDSVEWGADIDVFRAEQALKRAEERAHADLSYLQQIRAQAAMSRALARLKAANLQSQSK